MWKSIRLSLFHVCVILLIDLVVDVEEHLVVTLSRVIDLVADVEEHQVVTLSCV